MERFVAHRPGICPFVRQEAGELIDYAIGCTETNGGVHLDNQLLVICVQNSTAVYKDIAARFFGCKH